MPRQHEISRLPKLPRYTAMTLMLCLILLAGCSSRNTSANPSGIGMNTPAPTRQEAAIVQTAKKSLGSNYSWGGCNPSQGFDCSGLVWWTYRSNGYDIPRATDKQATMGREIDCAALRQGDVLIFRLSAKGLHSGIFSGNGQFIHSPKSGHTVREESLLKAYWQSSLATCRRVLQ